MFKKILIANRGEIAVRIVRACRDLGVSPVGVYSDADRDSLHVKLVDQAVSLAGTAATETYLNVERIIAAARKTGAEAIHPGYGFLSESEQLAKACGADGIVFIGPDVEALRVMGSKITSRRAAREAGVPPVPGDDFPLPGIEQACERAAGLGYPVMLKASAGGGGKGLRQIHDEAELRAAYDMAKGEASSSFGDSTVYLEKEIERARHVEVQLLGDQHGTLLHLGERECSIQRRHQKILEEAPSPIVDAELREVLGDAALKVGRSVGYYNAGTVEFLVDGNDPRRFFFLEMNTRLQVEHAVTEMVTGVDLVCEQIRIAAGHKLEFKQEDIEVRGAAIEVRIYAEDPTRHFQPAPGTVTELFEPAGPGIRNESSLYKGYSVPVHYDPLISKLVSYGRTREESISRLRRALGEFRVGGVPTNIPFLQALIADPDFLAGRLSTRFLEERSIGNTEEGDVALAPFLAAALDHAANLAPPNGRVQTPERPGGLVWKQLGRPGFNRRRTW